MTILRWLIASSILTSAGALADQPPSPSRNASLPELQQMVNKFAKVDISADISHLSDNDKRALAKLIQASQHVDALFMDQVWAGSAAWWLELSRDDSPLGKARLQAFRLNKGPWDRSDHERGFLAEAPLKPAQGNFYPSDARRDEVEAWVKTLPEAERAQATGFFTTIRRNPQGKLMFVPYSVEYQGRLQLIAQDLRDAAMLTSDASLKKFLQLRAAALLSNDYYASDVAWMELDGTIEPTVGPYEVYEDGWFNQKAAFETFITLRDDAETKKLEHLSNQLQALENSLPIADSLKNPKLGAMAPIRVVNSLYSAGDGNRGVQTAAFNLPNDERVTREKGAKRTMLRNIQDAKFNKVLVPIAKHLLSTAERKNVSFEAFFTAILMHELMHGLGPHETTVKGQRMALRQSMQETYSAIEEAKADVSGLWALQFLIDQGKIDKSMERSLYPTMVASLIRSLRFGINEAHGKGAALQLNYFMDKGAVTLGRDGKFRSDIPKMKEAVTTLTGELMTLQASGDRDQAQMLLARLGVLRPEVQKAMSQLTHIPTDIQPQYTTAQKLLDEVAKTPAPAPAAM